MLASRVSDREPVIVAHRGGGGLAPENTLAAFSLAVELGVDGIELDVQRSSDGHLVIFHDDDVGRVTDGDGFVCEMTLAELQKLDAGGKFDARFSGERIPTLEDFFDLMRGNDLSIVLELKLPARYPGIEAEVVDLIRRYGYTERMQIISFWLPSLHEINKIAPEMVIWEIWEDQFPTSEETTFPTLTVSHELYTEEIIAELHRRGQKASAWTVNEIEDARRLMAWGIDSLTTDYPDRMLALFEK